MVAAWPNAVKTWTPLIDDPTNQSKDPNALASAGHIQEVRDEVSAVQASLKNDGRYSVVLHEAAPDPHPQYLTVAEGDARYTTGGTTGITQAQGDSRYVLQGADPLPIYYNQTRGDTRYVQIANAFTQTAADARYPLKTDLDPYPGYLTATEGDARYPLASAADPYTQYFNQARGDARYILLTALRAGSKTFLVEVPSGTFPIWRPIWFLPSGKNITITAVSAYREGGAGVSINARRLRAGVAANLLTGDLTLASDSVLTAGTLASANTGLQGNDILQVGIMAVTTAPTYLAIQIDFTEKVTP